MNKTEIQLEIIRLTSEYQSELIFQNNRSSLVRNYSKADALYNRISTLESQLKK